ncbi:hypothetical protein [Caballeronia catudaia]|uniref:hypothetical protein n=1 Tax=Caballeronia catudaia TaxID=1777136 RepID=UPI000AF995C9|nr:hypothetical protein [Caballeronia catudaia]
MNQRHLQSACPPGQEQCVSGSTAEQASPCEADKEVAYELAGFLDMVSRGDYPRAKDDEDAPEGSIKMTSTI